MKLLTDIFIHGASGFGEIHTRVTLVENISEKHFSWSDLIDAKATRQEIAKCASKGRRLLRSFIRNELASEDLA